MKRTTLTAAAITLLSPLALADRFETLAGPRDSITLKAGEAALVTFVTDQPTVQYQKPGKRAVQFRLGKPRRQIGRFDHDGYGVRYDQDPSSVRPLALAGPATVKLMTDGVVSIRVVTNK